MPEIDDIQSALRSARSSVDLTPLTIGFDQRETEETIASLTAPEKGRQVPFSTAATQMRVLAQGKDKILYHLDSNRASVYMTAQNSLMNQRASNLKKEIEFTKNLGQAVLEKGIVTESNLATNILPAGRDSTGREYWETAKANADLEASMRGKDVSFHTRSSYCRQFINGMSNLHLVNRIHGDLKPENCLCFEDGTLRVADFGKGCIVEGDTAIPGYQGNTRFGPPEDAKSKSGDIY